MNIKERLKKLYEEKERTVETLKNTKSIWEEKTKRFNDEIVSQAFKEIKEAFEEFKRTVNINILKNHSNITISYQGKMELGCEINVRMSEHKAYPEIETRYIHKGLTNSSTGILRRGSQDYSVEDITKDEITKAIVDAYAWAIRI